MHNSLAAVYQVKRLEYTIRAALAFTDYLPEHSKVETALALLDVAETPEAVNLPGYRLHPLRGDLRGFWSIRVSGNWRIIFRFDDRDVCDVDLADYH